MSATTATAPATTAFDDLDRDFREGGPGAALDGLSSALADRGDFRALLDALLLKARYDLGLPLLHAGALADMPEPARSQYEERYVAAIRDVGRRFLDAGDIPAAWPYFRAIAEPGPVAEALDTFRPAEGDERLGQIIEVAFNQGAHPAKGFELILEHYGACSAISAFEHLPADESIRREAAGKLVRHLHDHLTASLRADIARHGQPLPPEGTSVPGLLAGRPWLFADDAYHLDTSHLAAVVRVGPLLTETGPLTLAAELAEYGRDLSDRHKFEGEPPFERTYEDHAVYLGALLGRDPDAAVAHFRAKLPRPDPASDYGPDLMPAQVLVRLLVRLGRLDEAIDVAAEHLAGVPESALVCPGVAQLCARAARPDRLARIARDQGDLIHYAAAILQGSSSGAGAVVEGNARLGERVGGDLAEPGE